jgi:hypothetical protein
MPLPHIADTQALQYHRLVMVDGFRTDLRHARNHRQHVPCYPRLRLDRLNHGKRLRTGFLYVLLAQKELHSTTPVKPLYLLGCGNELKKRETAMLPDEDERICDDCEEFRDDGEEDYEVEMDALLAQQELEDFENSDDDYFENYDDGYPEDSDF